VARRGKPSRSRREIDGLAAWGRFKYLLLFFITGAALLGVSFVFPAAPMVLATRFFGLLIYPVISLFGNVALTLLRPLVDALDMTSVAYLQIDVPRYALQWFTLITVGVILAASRLTPRCWCRYFCPAGAAFALFSVKPLIQRKVSDACVRCGECRQACPMAAIAPDPFETDFGACITCHACERICPTRAVSFGTGACETAPRPASPERRQVLLAGLAGAGTAMVTLTGLGRRRNDNAPGQIHPADLIRPPGAVPEKDFLARCIRCGQCMKACPTNTLQPMGLAVGIEAFFSPRVTPRRGPCEPLCNVCGEVCPTGAVRAVASEEKIWAKIGTAQILRQKCLAWEFDRRCLVCDEVCPYDAISLRSVAEASVPVPYVNESRCSGCGFCEHHCPVQARAAIIVEPMEALRLQEGSYREKGRAAGLNLSIGRRPRPEKAPYGPPSESGLPPGFTE
jgi:MauM/NapG family ferredoxin protein